MDKPSIKPQNPCFSSGPCAKRPGWSFEGLKDAYLGRSHRAAGPKARLKAVIEKQRALLGIPDDYKVGIVPASDTGAFEMAMWSMLGQRGVDAFGWETFGKGWLTDAAKHLKLEDLRLFEAPYGELPDLSQADMNRDIIFTWNGTTAGVCVPNGDWIAADREGLTMCDATSAVFAYEMPWDKLDVTTWSWQKVLGGEAAHGMLVLSPRAVERLESYTPDRPLPKIFRMTKNGKLNAGIFEGSTINTPSMLAVEDCWDALNWVESIGGCTEMQARCQRNFDAIARWVETSDWAGFQAKSAESRSITSVCISIKDPWFTNQSTDAQWDIVKTLCNAVEEAGAGYDFKNHRDAPPGLRIWCGATVETSDVEALLPWIDWAYAQVKADKAQKAA